MKYFIPLFGTASILIVISAFIIAYNVSPNKDNPKSDVRVEFIGSDRELTCESIQYIHYGVPHCINGDEKKAFNGSYIIHE